MCKIYPVPAIETKHKPFPIPIVTLSAVGLLGMANPKSYDKSKANVVLISIQAEQKEPAIKIQFQSELDAMDLTTI